MTTKSATPPSDTTTKTTVTKRSVKKSRSKPRSKQASSNVLGEIVEILRTGCSKQEFYRQSFRQIAAHFNSTYGLLNVRVGAQTLQDEYQSDDRCPEDVMNVVDAMTIEAEADERANVRLFPKERGKNTAVLSAPLYAGASQIGAICLSTTTKANKEARHLLSELIAILAFVGAQQGTDEKAIQATTRTSKGIDHALEKATKYESVNELAYSMVNNIAAKFNCDQVAFGMTADQRVSLSAISGLDRFSRSSHGVTQIQQAMEECADAREVIHYQLSGGFGESSGKQSFLLHRQWHSASNNASLLSVPIISTDEEVVAVVSLQRSSDRPFSQTEIDRIRELLQPFASVVKLLERASRSTFGQMKDSIVHGYRMLLQPNKLGRKVIAGAVAAAMLFFVFGWMPHRVSVPCHVEPSAINHVTAPFQATLRDVLVRDGDSVEAGQLIALLDSRPMELERDRLRAEMASLRIEMDRALANRNVAEAAMAQSNMNAAETQLNVIEDRINTARVVAPVDGIVLKGELDQRVGQLLMFGDPLIEIGSLDGKNVRLEIPEEQAPFVEAGQSGKFVSFVRPGTKLTFEVDQITPSSSVVGDKNVFLAEAKLESTPDWMRVGMEGTAKVSAGWQPTWWVVSHGLIDKIRMSLWW